jgi:TolA-binding protein
MGKKQYLLVAVLGLILTTAAVSATTFAFGGRGMGAGLQADDAMRQQIDTVQQSITNNDYNAWQQAMTTRVTEMRQQATDLETKINQDTFNKLTQAHQLMQDGKRDEAKAIFDELGMFGPMGHMGGRGMGQGMGPKAEVPANN